MPTNAALGMATNRRTCCVAFVAALSLAVLAAGGQPLAVSSPSAGISAGIKEDLYDVALLTPERGFAVGDAGVIVASEDGGRSVRGAPSGGNDPALHLAFVDEQSDGRRGRLGVARLTDGRGM